MIESLQNVNICYQPLLCLPHDLMAAKHIAYGMSHSAVKILISYLRHCKQRVKIGSDTSDWMTILKGIPQGSI